MKTWIPWICALLILTSCRKAQSSAEDGRLAEAQAAKLSAETDKARATISQLETAAAANAKQLAEMQKMQQALTTKLAEINETRQAADKSVATLKELSGQTEAVFEAVRKSTANTNQQISYLRNKLFELEITALQEKPATLSTSKKEYDLARTDMGSFPISVEKAEPYLDGHKLTFSIGNPLSAALTGAKLTIKYGKRMPPFPVDANGQLDFGAEVQAKYKTEKEAWDKSLKTMEVGVNGNIGAGSWTSVEAILTPTKPEEVAYLQVSLASTGLTLGGLRR